MGTRPGAGPAGGWEVWLKGRTSATSSGWRWQSSQSRQCTAELVFPRPALGKMQGEAPGLAGEPSGQGEEASPEGLGGDHLLAQTNAPSPAG